MILTLFATTFSPGLCCASGACISQPPARLAVCLLVRLVRPPSFCLWQERLRRTTETHDHDQFTRSHRSTAQSKLHTIIAGIAGRAHLLCRHASSSTVQLPAVWAGRIVLPRPALGVHRNYCTPPLTGDRLSPRHLEGTSCCRNATGGHEVYIYFSYKYIER